MTDFEKAMNAYFDHFGVPYPYAVGIGFKGETDEENIEIIREAIEKNEPVVLAPDYRDDLDY